MDYSWTEKSGTKLTLGAQRVPGDELSPSLLLPPQHTEQEPGGLSDCFHHHNNYFNF